ncbi:MAG: Crp/Fnr family transcriptional regulator [Alphaproteobacteria bacterium]|nr:Crp/Fnr family transcriptional regulator [Alphaproteobacteria bacterium]
MEEQSPNQLATVELLSGVAPEALQRLGQGCMWRRYKRGEEIVARDSDSRDLFLVVTGSVEVANFSTTGREIAYATIPAGEYFGELSAIDNLPRSATVSAAEGSLLAVVPRTLFLDLMRDEPDAALKVMSRLARIIRICDDRIMDLSTLGAVQRVYIELLRICGPDPAVPNLWSVYPMPTQSDIAARASTTRETVARVISQLTQDEIIQRKGRTLYINDRERLQEMAASLEGNAAAAR